MGACAALVLIFGASWFSIFGVLLAQANGHEKESIRSQWAPITITLGPTVALGNNNIGSQVGYVVNGVGYQATLDLGQATHLDMLSVRQGTTARAFARGAHLSLTPPRVKTDVPLILLLVLGGLACLPLGGFLGHVGYKTCLAMRNRSLTKREEELQSQIVSLKAELERSRQMVVDPNLFTELKQLL
jgi:hypothetical protein